MLTGQTAEETTTDMQIGTQESALEEHPLEQNLEKENERESPEDAGEELEKGYAEERSIQLNQSKVSSERPRQRDYEGALG